jgi:hypothetical protein
MTHKLTKREIAVLDYLEAHAKSMKKNYTEAYFRKDENIDWYIGHSAEASIVYSHVLNILKGEDK